jgi:endonuclease/exonuclease/phosphatase (EEP) superfamily protein YafD
MKGLLLLSFSLLFISSQGFAKKIPQGHEKCSWACKSIPPLSESYLQYGNATLAELPSEKLKVFIWNIYKGKKKDFLDYYPAHIQNADLALIQEYITTDQILNTLVPYKDQNMSVSFWMKKQRKTGVITVSSAQSLGAFVQRTVDLEPFVKSPKVNMVTYHQLKDTDQTLLSINIHGINMTATITLQRQIQLAAGHLKHHTGPVIFAGDFNTRNIERQEMVDVFMDQYNLKKVIFPNEFRGKKKLDHTYIKGLRVDNAHLYLKNKGSDHPAMYVELSLVN